MRESKIPELEHLFFVSVEAAFLNMKRELDAGARNTEAKDLMAANVTSAFKALFHGLSYNSAYPNSVKVNQIGFDHFQSRGDIGVNPNEYTDQQIDLLLVENKRLLEKNMADFQDGDSFYHIYTQTMYKLCEVKPLNAWMLALVNGQTVHHWRAATLAKDAVFGGYIQQFLFCPNAAR